MLAPYPLERVHGPVYGQDAGSATGAGLPFPLLPEGEPMTVTLRGGMTRSQVGNPVKCVRISSWT